MARSHHRKKHKAHLRQFKHSQESAPEKAKGKAARVFALVGAVLGFAITYFVTEGAIAWMMAGLVVVGAAGYFWGRKIDAEKK